MIAERDAMSRQYYVSPYCAAMVRGALGEADQAFQRLEQCYEQRDQWLVWLKVDPMVDGLRPDPRFSDLAQRVGLPCQVVAFGS